MTSPSPLLKLQDISRSFTQGETRLEVLKNVSLAVYPGELVALLGPSGSGKSTLLHIAGLLEKPEAGHIQIENLQVQTLSDKERTVLRRRTIGFVYQYHHLLPEFTSLENVILPQIMAGQDQRKAEMRSQELLKQVGLGARLQHRPAKLSGGEQQRVAIARALANQPKLLLADEPTGNLDHHTSDDVFSLLLNLVRQQGLAAVIATHNLDLAHRMDRIVELQDGILVDIKK